MGLTFLKNTRKYKNAFRVSRFNNAIKPVLKSILYFVYGAKHFIADHFRIMALIILTDILIPLIAFRLRFIIPCQFFNLSHNFAIVFQIIKGRVKKDKIIAYG